MEPITTQVTKRKVSSAAPVFGLTVLFCSEPSLEGRFVALSEKTLSVGRDSAVDGLRLPDPEVSRRHAAVSWNGAHKGYLLRDEGSRNGTFVNQKPIRRRMLVPGDVVRVGNSVLRFGRQPAGESGWRPEDDSLLKGCSPALQEISRQIDRVADDSDMAVLILGETGAGKDVVAREIHRRSGRSGPFIAINCAAISTELLEPEMFGYCRGAFSGATRGSAGIVRSAEGGTLFLDEVGELPPFMQPKLLRLIECRHVRPVGATREEPVDVRFLFATNRPIHEASVEQPFRRDLFARLRQWSIIIPPLRERPEDLMPILRHMLQTQAADRTYHMTGELFEALALYDWPFNVRELLHFVRALAAQQPQGGDLNLTVLPLLRPTGQTAPAAPEPAEIDTTGEQPPDDDDDDNDAALTSGELHTLLQEHQGNVSAVARVLGCGREQVYRKAHKLGLMLRCYRDTR